MGLFLHLFWPASVSSYLFKFNGDAMEFIFSEGIIIPCQVPNSDSCYMVYVACEKGSQVPRIAYAC